MRRIETALVLLSSALLHTGCVFLIPDRIHYELEPMPRASPLECARPEPGDRPETIFGLALSGGGSRAAVFGAAGMEALWEHGLLGQISHVSSVSGGSFAASYFAVNKPDCEQAPSEAEKNTCWREFFSEFKQAMRYNYWNWMELRQIIKPNRFMSPTRRTSSLQEALDRRFLHEKTFGELKPAAWDAGAGQALERPVLLINASSYDEARRFVFSNLCFPESSRDGSDSSARTSRSRYEPLTRKALRAQTFSRPACARAVPSDFPISLAVAASAAFPPLIGPVAFRVPSACHAGEPNWWHLGDGGIIDNTGVDTLEEIVLRELEEDGARLKNALIVSLDSGKITRTERMQLEENLRIWTRDPGRVADASMPRGFAYHDIVWDRLRSELSADGISMKIISMRYTTSDLDHWPASCKKRRKSGKSDENADRLRVEINEHLHEIPTDLEISTCDADLMEMAAHRVVHDALNGEMTRRLMDRGFSIREVHE